jgi:hypothetical protein
VPIVHPKRVRATYPVQRFNSTVTKPGKVTDGTYLITVRGLAGPSVRAAFDDVEISAVGDTTVLRRPGTDQAALHGLFHRIENLGLEVIDVHLESAESTARPYLMTADSTSVDVAD